MKPAKQTEKQVITSCKAWFKRNGWICKTIYTGGIPTFSGMQVPNPCKGIPDSINFHLGMKLVIWVEYKSSTGRISDEQETWHTMLRACNQYVLVVNSLESLKSQIMEIVNESK